MISPQDKNDLVKKFGRAEGDTGSPEVQIAILTKRITNLTPHFTKHHKDHHSKTGLMKLIGRRRRLLKYLNSENTDAYTKLIKELGLRK